MQVHYENAKEVVPHKINTQLRVFINRYHADFSSHWHTDIEIIWPKEAPYKVVCGNQTYYVEIDDILLICPAVLHEIFSLSPGSRMYIQADLSKLSGLKEIDKAFRLMSPALHIKKKTCPVETYEYLSGCLNKIMELYFGSAPKELLNQKEIDESIITLTELKPFDELEIYSLIMQFIGFCGRNINLFQGADPVSASISRKKNITLSNVCVYISDHFTEDLTLEQIATYAGFSKFHFERIFTEYTGMTFYQYLQQMRINYAQTLLSNPELTITDISYQAGFSSSMAFTRAFKKSTGYPPSQFRLLNEHNTPVNANPHYAKVDFL
ncbi:MAG: AraC family transcriptional regulator [Lachnospiraceae bacterium]|nr:AraC family transcriptional regulator [Lachnospiraceae bacterium]